MSDMPRPLIAGNWKMNGLKADGAALAQGLCDLMSKSPAPNCGIVVCPPATLLAPVAEILAGTAIELGAQDCHAAASGAHTGDISAPMLADLGCRYVILGHSERRSDHAESDGEVRAKAEAAHAAGLEAIICVGETESERDQGRALDIVGAQLRGSLPAAAQAGNSTVAYEPVWAIGTGRTPSSEQIAEMHAHIRSELTALIGDDANRVPLLYGGSVKPDNARDILAIGNVDGALVGGASLKADDFWAIGRSCP